MDPYGRHHPAVPGQPPHVSGHERVGNAQRTTVLDKLSRAVEEGYLDLDEYEARMARVTESRTVAALYKVVADLPPQFRWDPSQPAPKSTQERQRESVVGVTVASLILGVVSLPFSLCLGAGIVPGLIAVFLARKGMREDETRSKALAGLVLGIVGITASLIAIVLLLLSPETRTVN